MQNSMNLFLNTVTSTYKKKRGHFYGASTSFVPAGALLLRSDFVAHFLQPRSNCARGRDRRRRTSFPAWNHRPDFAPSLRVTLETEPCPPSLPPPPFAAPKTLSAWQLRLQWLGWMGRGGGEVAKHYRRRLEEIPWGFPVRPLGPNDELTHQAGAEALEKSFFLLHQWPSHPFISKSDLPSGSAQPIYCTVIHYLGLYRVVQQNRYYPVS